MLVGRGRIARNIWMVLSMRLLGEQGLRGEEERDWEQLCVTVTSGSLLQWARSWERTSHFLLFWTSHRLLSLCPLRPSASSPKWALQPPCFLWTTLTPGTIVIAFCRIFSFPWVPSSTRLWAPVSSLSRRKCPVNMLWASEWSIKKKSKRREGKEWEEGRKEARKREFAVKSNKGTIEWL